MVKSAPPNPSITAMAEWNSALEVELQDPPEETQKQRQNKTILISIHVCKYRIIHVIFKNWLAKS